jgi:hypothetical protein
MPKVPLYEGNQVRSTPLQPVMQRAPDVSSGLMAAGQALRQVSDVAEREVIRNAEAEANAADSRLTADWLQWDADNRKLYQGANVGEYEAKAKEWWSKAQGEYAQGVSPLAQRRLTDVLARKSNQALGSVLGYAGAERERHADSAAEAAVQTSIEFGVDTGNVTGARDEVRTITAQQAARKRWTTEQLQVEQQRRLGTLHLAYITRLAETDATKAQEYYTTNKGEIPGATRTRVEQVLKGEIDNQFATKFAAEHATKPLDEQIAAAATITDPHRREKALQQIKQNQALIDAAQRQREQRASDDAWQMVAQGKRVPERVLLQMNGRERVQVNDYLRQRAEQGAKPVKTDPLALAAVYDMIRENPEGFKNIRMETLAFKLAGSDIEQVARIQRDMRNPGSEKDIVGLSAQLGPYTDLMDRNDKALFEAKAFGQVIEFQQNNKRPPTSKERQEIFDALKMEVVTHKGIWWNSTKERYKLTPEQEAKAGGTPVRVTDINQARALPKGTRFIDPQGIERER